MEHLKIREDRVNNLRIYACENCNNIPKENSVIIEPEINYEHLIFCSEECILNYLKTLEDTNDVLVRKQIKTYKKTPINDLAEEIFKMNPNTRKILENGWSIDYFNINNLKEHYILNMSTHSKLFTSAIELAQYITK